MRRRLGSHDDTRRSRNGAWVVHAYLSRSPTRERALTGCPDPDLPSILRLHRYAPRASISASTGGLNSAVDQKKKVY